MQEILEFLSDLKGETNIDEIKRRFNKDEHQIKKLLDCLVQECIIDCNGNVYTKHDPYGSWCKFSECRCTNECKSFESYHKSCLSAGAAIYIELLDYFKDPDSLPILVKQYFYTSKSSEDLKNRIKKYELSTI